MSGILNLTLTLTGKGTLQGAPSTGAVTDKQILGNSPNNFPSDKSTQGLTLSSGIGAGLANQWFCGVRPALAATTYDLINISSAASGIVNNLLQNLQLTTVQGLLIVILNPDGLKSLRVGPQNQTHAWQGPFGGVGSTNYLEVYDQLFLSCDFAGGIDTNNAIGSTANILPIYNPGASPVTYGIWIIGTEG